MTNVGLGDCDELQGGELGKEQVEIKKYLTLNEKKISGNFETEILKVIFPKKKIT